ncbi:MAG: insulinase family protein, partial [Burkholderiales bacterium]|nr:insulinase family protein [Burkholderiales bacterium]
YGKSTIGNRSDIENVKIENLQAFYHRYYRPDNAVLTVSGKFDVQKTLDLIAKDFGKIENPKEALPQEWTVEPTADGERNFQIRRRGEAQLVAVAYRIPSALHPDIYAVETAVDVLSDVPNGRLYDSLVKPGLATQVFGYAVGAKQPGYAVFGAVVKKGESIEAVKNKLIDTIETSLEKTPMTAKELERAKQEAQTSFERAFSDPEGFAVGLSEYIALGDWRLFFYGRDETSKVTAEQADNVASKYFVRDNRVVGEFIPEDSPKRAEIPQAPSAQELLSSYKAKQDTSQAEAFDASYDNLNARTIRFQVGNLKVSMLPKKNRAETVKVSLDFPYGNEKNLFGKNVIPAATMAMLSRGTKDMTRGQIEDEMTKLKMTGGIGGFVTTRDNLDKALTLIAYLYHNASFPQDEFDQLKKQLTVMAESSRDKPDTLADEAIGQHFNTYPKGDVRHSSTIAENLEDINKLTLEDVKKHAKDFFGTARGEISIVGDFDPKSAEATIKQVFTDYPSKAEYARIIREYKPIEATRIVIDTPEKENAVLTARAVFPINEEDEDAIALEVANWILGGGTGLSNRIIDRLRQKEGLSYGAGSGVRIPTFGNNGVFAARAIVAPQNLLKAEASLKDVIDKAVKEGFTELEVEEAKKGIIQSSQVARAQDRYLVSSWQKKLDTDRDWNYNKDREEKLKVLTLDQVNAALRKYIKPDEITFVLAGDMSKAEPKEAETKSAEPKKAEATK